MIDFTQILGRALALRGKPLPLLAEQHRFPVMLEADFFWCLSQQSCFEEIKVLSALSLDITPISKWWQRINGSGQWQSQRYVAGLVFKRMDRNHFSDGVEISPKYPHFCEIVWDENGKITKVSYETDPRLEVGCALFTFDPIKGAVSLFKNNLSGWPESIEFWEAFENSSDIGKKFLMKELFPYA